MKNNIELTDEEKQLLEEIKSVVRKVKLRNIDLYEHILSAVNNVLYEKLKDIPDTSTAEERERFYEAENQLNEIFEKMSPEKRKIVRDLAFSAVMATRSEKPAE